MHSWTFFQERNQYLVGMRKCLLLGNMSLTVLEKVVLLSGKCSFGSIWSINRNKEGRKEGRKERREGHGGCVINKAIP